MRYDSWLKIDGLNKGKRKMLMRGRAMGERGVVGFN